MGDPKQFYGQFLWLYLQRHIQESKSEQGKVYFNFLWPVLFDCFQNDIKGILFELILPHQIG
jgi:hypothetical protein